VLAVLNKLMASKLFVRIKAQDALHYARAFVETKGVLGINCDGRGRNIGNVKNIKYLTKHVSAWPWYLTARLV